MPPKPKFSREDIVDAALAVISEKDADALTAREVARQLGCSTRPIFTAFKDMDELKNEVRLLAAKNVAQSSFESMLQSHSFLDAEIRAIRFAMEYPNLYKLVFLTGNGPKDTIDELLVDTAVPTSRYAEFFQQEYGLDAVEAELLFSHAWIFTLGLGALCATKRYTFTQDELRRMLSANFWAMHAYIKAGGHKADSVTPVPIR